LIGSHLVQDQMGRWVEVPKFPKRIISLVPSQSELLYDFGVEERVVGITKFCIHPSLWLTSKAIIGGTKKFRFDIIEALQPDLIIGNKEENYREGIEELEKSYPVWMSDIYTVDDALNMVEALGLLVNTADKAAEIHSCISKDLNNNTLALTDSALYLIWKSPYMAAGENTFINEMMKVAGFKNILEGDLRYPELSLIEIKEYNPDYILLSSEPYPFCEKHVSELQTLLPDTTVILVNGEVFSWYGSRLLKAKRYFDAMKK